jgi:hypothetical protein
MTDESPPLTPDEKVWAFRKATNSVENAPKRWTERVRTGLTDEQLAAAIKYELGEMGGYCGSDGVSVEYEGNGLKIWAAHGMPHRHTETPMCAGPATLRLAREVYGIADPEEKQMGLF